MDREHRSPTARTDALRTALGMVRADWQGDQQSWEQLWAAADDPEAVARELSRIARDLIEKLASVGGISTGEMLHRMAGSLIPQPDAGRVIDLEARDELARDSG